MAPARFRYAAGRGGQQPVFLNPTETLHALASPTFDPRHTVYLPLEARNQIAAKSSQLKTVSSSFSAQRLSIQFKADSPALLVVAQSFFPAWHASLDGHPVIIWPANYAFQAVAVPAGNHALVLVYRDGFFYTGAAISAVTLAVCFLLFRRLRRRTAA